VATLVAAVVLLGAFWQIERRAVAPLAPVRILDRPSVKWGNIAGFVIFSMESAVVFLMTLYLGRVLGMSALVSGLALGLPGLSAVAAGILAPRVLGRFGTRQAVVVGLVVQAMANGVLLWTGRAHWGVALIVAALTIGFFGHVTAIVRTQ
jgi:Na+/melibiose symporter-like transporter